MTADWESLIPDGFNALYDSPAWHQVMAGDMEPVVITRADPEGRVRAVVPVHHYPDGPPNPYLHPAMLFGGGADASGSAVREWGPVTVLGAASGYASAPIADDVVAWDAAVTEALARHPRGTVLMPYLTESVASAIGARFGAPPLLTELRVIMPVLGPTWAEHCAVLPGGKRRRLGQEVRRLERSGRTMSVARLAEIDIAEMSALQAQTQQHHGAPGDAAAFCARWDRLAASTLGDDTVVFACRDEGRLVAVNLTIAYRGVLSVRTVGLDYASVGEHAEYPNVLVNAPIQYAVEHGLTTVDLGIAAQRAKLQRAGQAVLMWSVLLRSGAPWPETATRAHNQAKSAALLADLGELLDPTTVARLTALATEVPASPALRRAEPVAV